MHVKILKDSVFAHPTKPERRHIRCKAGDEVDLDDAIAETAIKAERAVPLGGVGAQREDKTGPSDAAKREDKTGEGEAAAGGGRGAGESTDASAGGASPSPPSGGGKGGGKGGK